MKALIISTALILGALAAQAAIQTKTIEYQQNGDTLEGVLVWDDATAGKRPGVLIVHQWLGLTDYEIGRAKQLAGLGCVAFCADIYGKGIRPTNTDEAGKLAGKYKSDRQLLRGRAVAALNVLKGGDLTDPKNVAAIGYCFGGTTVLELARTGAELNGVVSFHGGLDSPTPDDGKNIKCKVLVLAGANDPFQKASDLEAFEKEMRDNKVDWSITFYGNAVHSFTQPNPGFVNPGAQYNEKADKRSWQAMRDFFAEIFK
ncbi:MAG TPA: dienelactone hydrolase family protein [Candidatus Sulfotelmatobacter sp.]|jgi:dienelactone hydrolase|nr:dienelactone hydrolase family protein [Candidatus Sulfotelmatobacter sp.]